jgi:hypothetical protein
MPAPVTTSPAARPDATTDRLGVATPRPDVSLLPVRGQYSPTDVGTGA